MLGLLTCAALGWWQFGSTGNKTIAGGYVLMWGVFGAYIPYLWWKLIHQKKLPFDKEWAAKARAAAEAAGRPLTEIPGWALDKDLRRAVFAANRGHPEALALSSGEPTAALKSSNREGPRAQPMTPEVAECSVSGGLAADHTDGVPDDADRIIDARVISSTVLRDEELAAYNQYLFELSQRNPPKQWRTPKNPPPSSR